MLTALKDYRTTSAGLVLGILGVLAIFGIEVPTWITESAITIGAAVLMFVARDKQEQ